MSIGAPIDTVLDNDTLRTFVAIIETGKFSTAAQAVGRSPSAVSMQIKRLEQQLNSELFVRGPHNIKLTDRGEALLPYARAMLKLSDEAISQSSISQIQGVVKLGAPLDLSERIVPRLLQGLAVTYPRINIDVIADTSDNLIRRMDDGQLDLALINFSARNAGGPGEVLGIERLVWAGAKHGIAYLRDPLPLAVFADACCWRSAALDQLQKSDRAYRLAYLSTRTMVQRAAVLADQAISPLPLSCIEEGMAVLGTQEGFDELPGFEIRLLAGADPTDGMHIVSAGLRRMLQLRTSPLPTLTKAANALS